MELSERITRGIQAREILDNAIYQESIAIVKQEILDAWQTTPARDVEGREALYLMAKLTDKLQLTIQTVLETGKLAELDLKHQESLAEKAKRTIKNW